MDSQRFDTLTAAFAQPHTRRRAIGVMGAVIAGVVGAASRDAAAKKRRKKTKPQGATCRDGRRNGAETDIDCGGGTCPRCQNGKTCGVANDCVSGTCTSGQCVTCTPTQLCGSDAHGACRCDEDFATRQPVCDSSQPLGLTVDDCAKCPAGTETCVTINGLLFNCYKRCGSA
jgi:hypothetical protein